MNKMSVTASLYDILVGSFIERGDEPENTKSSYFENLTEGEKLRSSIIENMMKIFNSRRGSVAHLPDFGIMDFSTIKKEKIDYKQVKKQMRETLLKYEPRLKDIIITGKTPKSEDSSWILEIHADIPQLGGKELIITEFSTTGWIKVIFKKDETE
jgi:type VI secretion system protein